jgi:hypothetical protein
MSGWTAAKLKAVQEFCPDKFKDKCYRCSQEYYIVDNIGRFLCSYHPGEYSEDTGWSCCKKKKRKIRWRNFHGFGVDKPVVERHSGCTPCDHNDEEPVNLTEYLALTEYLTPYAQQMQANGAVNEDFYVIRKPTGKPTGKPGVTRE